MNPALPPTCPQCGKPLPAATPLGLCPECLLRAGLPTTPASAATGVPAAGARFQAPSPAELAPHFPQLEIFDLIGQGGMGAVYKARQPALDRLVALKILRPRDDAEPAFAERFAREARALAKLSHPNIVAVHDFGQAGGFHFLLMEFVDGTSLRQAMQAGRMAPREALAIVPPLCDALQYAHDRGIVHRDIKPENILLARDGTVKVADFGLAKLTGARSLDTALTGIGDVMGTPHYMAPEQVEHPQAVDHRADIYSLGVVFYQMLTGELPLGRFAPPSQRVQVDVRLDEIVLRTLEKEPERRYQQASEVKTDVVTVVTEPSPGRATRGAEDRTMAERVRWPATLLLVFSGLNAALLAGVAVARIFGLVVAEGMFAPSIIALSWGAACSGFSAFAAWRMGWVTGWGISLAGAVVAVLSAPWAAIPGVMAVPVAIWAIVILSLGEVRRLFADNPAGLPAGWRGSRARRRATLAASVLLLAVAGGLLFAWSVDGKRSPRDASSRIHRDVPKAGSAVDAARQSDEYRSLVRSVVDRHDSDDLEVLLAVERDALRQAEARYDAGLADSASVRDAKMRVDFMTAELSGASDHDLLDIRLRAARDRLVVIEGRKQAGVIDDATVAAARDEVRLIEAVLSDDPVAPFRVIFEQRSREFKAVEVRYSIGLADVSEMREAKLRLDLASRRLARVYGPVHLEELRQAGKSP